MAQLATSAVSYRSFTDTPPPVEATYEDLECCLITMRDVLAKMSAPRGWTARMRAEWPSRLIAEMIAMIDKAHPPDQSSLTRR